LYLILHLPWRMVLVEVTKVNLRIQLGIGGVCSS